MGHFIEDVSHLSAPALGVFLERAKGLYDENMSTYVKLMLRKSFGRMIVRRLLIQHDMADVYDRISSAV